MSRTKHSFDSLARYVEQAGMNGATFVDRMLAAIASKPGAVPRSSRMWRQLQGNTLSNAELVAVIRRLALRERRRPGGRK